MAIEDPDALFLGHVGQKVILQKDGKVLMCRNVGSPRWDFPGGRIHKDESVTDALKREVLEELGVSISVGDPFFVCEFPDTDVHVPRYYIVFDGTLIDPGAPFTLAQDEIAEVRWVGSEDLATLETWEDWRTVLTLRAS